MKTLKVILTLPLLPLATAAGAGDFGLNMLTASDIRPSASAYYIPAPTPEISAMDEAETASYLADRETPAEAAEKGLGILYERLEQIDPVVAGRVHPNDEKRIVRALEVFELSGKRLSDWEKETVSLEQEGYRFVMAGLTRDRDELYRRIDGRVDSMFRKGLVREARGLFKKKLSVTAHQAIGYRELFDHFEGRITLKEAKEQIKQNTRNFAKRQITWFKRESRIRWFDSTDENCAREIAKMAAEL